MVGCSERIDREECEDQTHVRDTCALPTLHYITEQLAEIPVYSVAKFKRKEGREVSDVSGVVRLN